ncbi:MAG: Cna B-type domain-containing protein [Atopobiaceae bacterium]|nr:Cna B-type domain-containing protein [Atopobiaceae bacterium]
MADEPELLFAYDVAIYSGEERFQPAEGEAVKLTVSGLATDADAKVAVTHAKADVATAEGAIDEAALAAATTNAAAGTLEVESLAADAATAGSVSFELSSLSVVLATEEVQEITPDILPAEDPDDEEGVPVGALRLTWDFAWQNGISSSTVDYEYTDEEHTNLLFHPESVASNQKANLKIELHVAGSKDDSIPAGTVRMEIPYSAFNGWDSKAADTIVTQLPKKPETNTQSNFWWYTDEENDKIIIENHTALNGGRNLSTEFSFEVYPLDIDGGYPDEAAAVAAGYVPATYDVGEVSGDRDIDRYCWEHKDTCWKDYYTKDIPCTVIITEGGQVTTEETKNLSVGMMTRAGGQVYARPMPDEKNGVYTKWQRTWGTTTDAEGQYFYVVWNLNYGRLASSGDTQPWEIDAAYDKDFGAITIGDKTFTGTYVGMLHSNSGYSQAYYDKDRNSYLDCMAGYNPQRQMQYSNIGESNNTNFKEAFSDHGLMLYKEGKSGFSGSGVATGNVADTYSNDCGQHYAVLVKYPMEEIIAACNEINPATGEPYVDLANAGLDIYAKFDVTETWEATTDQTDQSGQAKHYQLTRSAIGGPANLNIKPSGGEGIFNKISISPKQTSGAQTVLANGSDVDLISQPLDGYTKYPYRMSYSGRSRTSDDVIMGQHIVIEEEQLMLSSYATKQPDGSRRYNEGWTPNATSSAEANAYPVGTRYLNGSNDEGDGNYFLTDADYDLPRFNVLRFDEYLGSYNDYGTSGMHWDYDGVPDNHYENYEPIYIYTRAAGASDYQPYCAVIKAANGNNNNAYTKVFLWDGNMQDVVDEEGNVIGEKPVLGAEISADENRHYALRQGTVQVRYEHDSKSPYLRCELQVSIHVNLHATEAVKKCVNYDINYAINGNPSPVATMMKNIANYKTYDYMQSGDYEGQQPNYKGDNVMADHAGDVRWLLTRAVGSLSVNKYAYTPADEEAEQVEAGLHDKQMSYVRLHVANSTGFSKDLASTTDCEEPYKLLSGTFYELLPKGVTVQNDSVFGVYNTNWDSHQYNNSFIGANGKVDRVDYKDFANYKFVGMPAKSVVAFGASQGNSSYYFLKEDEFSWRQEYVPELDQYMLIIDYAFDNLDTYFPSTWTCYMDFFFIAENTVANIRARGTSTQNYVGFENTSTYTDQSGQTNHGISLPANGSKVTTLPDDVREALTESGISYQNITDNNANSGFGQTPLPWNVVTTTESGFDKMVSTPETLDGAVQTEKYDSEGARVTVGNRYTYRLRYATMEGTKSDQVIFYDIFETGTDAETSYWKGWLDSSLANPIDLSSIRSVLSDGSETATCDPVLYYYIGDDERVMEINQDYAELEEDGSLNSQYWTTDAPDDLSTVKGIAIDCRKNTDGEDFHLGSAGMLCAWIHMVAPSELPENPDAFAVNGSVVQSREFTTFPGDVQPEPEQQMSRAFLQLRDVDVTLVKDSDPMTGVDVNDDGTISDGERTQVKADGTGTIDYRLTVTNNMPFDTTDVVISDPLPEHLTLAEDSPIEVELNGRAIADADDLAPEFTYSYDEATHTLTFNIARQHVNSDTKIYIHTTVDSLYADANNGTQVPSRNYDNTAYLTSANTKSLIDQDHPDGIPTDTMYHRAETTTVPVEKVWVDGEDHEGERPESLTVNLTGLAKWTDSSTDPATEAEQSYPDDKSLVLNEDGNWKGTFADLSKYYVDDTNTDYDVPTTWHEYAWSADEVVPENYKHTVVKTVDPATGITSFAITNVRDWQYADFDFMKKGQGDDAGALAGAKFQLFTDEACTTPLKDADGNPFEAESGDDGKVSFTKVPFADATVRVDTSDASKTVTTTVATYYMKETVAPTNYYRNNNIYKVTLTKVVTVFADGTTPAQSEVKPAKIDIVGTADPNTGDLTGSETAGYVILDKQYTSVPVDKEWLHADGSTDWPTGWTGEQWQEGVKVTINLLADGTKVADVTLSADKTSHVFENLPKYKADGKTPITYKLTEDSIPGYVATIDASAKTVDESDAETSTVKNTIKNEQVKTTVDVNKSWLNPDDSETWPDDLTITVQLVADGKTVSGKTATLTKDATSYKFEGLPKYQPGTETEIAYTIEEVSVEGYRSVILGNATDGYIVKNVFDPADMDFDFLKVGQLPTDRSSYAPLQGAEFTLFKDQDCTTPVTAAADDTTTPGDTTDDGNAPADPNGTRGDDTTGGNGTTNGGDANNGGDATGGSATEATFVNPVTTDENGKGEFKKVPFVSEAVQTQETDQSGKVTAYVFTTTETYYMKETKAPTGWLENSSVYKVTLTKVLTVPADGSKPTVKTDFAIDVVTQDAKTGALVKKADSQSGKYEIKDELAYGDLEIVKSLAEWEGSSANATFEFDVTATIKGETVYSNAAAIHFKGPGTQSAVLTHIPAGATVTVTERYTGSTYVLAEGVEPTQEQTIAADVVMSVEFDNDYTENRRGGSGVTNKFIYDDQDWDEHVIMVDGSADAKAQE